jgi:hypothetical protein
MDNSSDVGKNLFSSSQLCTCTQGNAYLPLPDTQPHVGHCLRDTAKISAHLYLRKSQYSRKLAGSETHSYSTQDLRGKQGQSEEGELWRDGCEPAPSPRIVQKMHNSHGLTMQHLNSRLRITRPNTRAA